MDTVVFIEPHWRPMEGSIVGINSCLHGFDPNPEAWFVRNDWSVYLFCRYLHEVCAPPVVHRNFKSANILLDDELNPHISDCGLAALAPSGSERQVYYLPFYISPVKFLGLFKVDVHNPNIAITWKPFVSGMWLGEDPTTDTKKTCWKEIGLCAQNMLIFLGSIFNMIGGTYVWPRNEHENIHIGNACQIHVFWLVIKLYRMMTGICTDVGFIRLQCTGVCHVWHLHCEEWCLQFWCCDVGASYWAQAFGQVQPSVCLPKLSLNTVANCRLRLSFHILCRVVSLGLREFMSGWLSSSVCVLFLTPDPLLCVGFQVVN